MLASLRKFNPRAAPTFFETSFEAHLWTIDLSCERASVGALYDSLSPDEEERAGKYRFKNDRSNFIVMRGAVREILSFYLGCHPKQICFSYNRYGKPALRRANSSLHFNASRSGKIAVCAVTRGRAVGVDVEFVNEESENLEIARRFFSNGEAAQLGALPPDERNAAFYRCWTRREAFLKVVGEGLSYPLESFSVPIGAKKSVRISAADRFQKMRRWSLETFAPHPDYAAALAVEGAAPTIKFRRWSENSSTAFAKSNPDNCSLFQS